MFGKMFGKIKPIFQSIIKEASSPSCLIKKIVKNFLNGMTKFSEESRLANSLNLSKFYATRSSVHGVRYILDPELNIWEKSFWLICVIISIFLTGRIFIVILTAYEAAPTVTVIDSTSHKVSLLPFPSVTICPNDRVNWKKALEVEKKFSNDSEFQKSFRKLLATLSTMQFDKFNKLSFLKEEFHPQFLSLNVSDLVFKTMQDCDQIFTNCNWENKFVNCCKIFQIQKTEYGMCYSFNSKVSENVTASNEKSKQSSGYGQRSGLKIKLKLKDVTNPTSIYLNSSIDDYRNQEDDKEANTNNYEKGIFVSINDPLVWPSVMKRLNSGMKVNINVKCTSGYASEDVLNMPPNKIPCRVNDHKTNRRYSQETCISECKRQHVYKHCKCNPSFYFASTDVRSCTVEDFKCIYEKKAKFDDYQNIGDNDFDSKNNEIMTCDCPPACNFYNFESKVLLMPRKDTEDLTVYVHFDGATSIRYRMNAVMTGILVLVHFGAVFALFVGGSVISLIEIIYIFVIWALGRIFSQLKANEERENPENMPQSLKLYLSDFPPIKS